ncbi:MAG: oligopeptide transporter ATP-binding protein [Symbiobacteriaceae bacterium]|jgi:oligopeptide/dipeptide ABC transporter ATP-binding protein|nr:oligopeptide transporter ATP-binding protein [Symbiobacteriaceae bacterium]
MSEKLVDIRNLKTYFYTEDGVVPAVDGVDLYVKRGETLGVVGESGCGKSVTSLSVMRLIASPPGKIVDGEILFEGEDLVKKSEAEMRKIRGNDISMIFQEPMTSLNPVYTIGDQIGEAIVLHQGLSKKEALEKAIEMLRLVGIPLPERRVHEYPHQLSGGMRQRVMIAMALSCNPKLLIADEPTTALDVTIQAQILELMKKLKKELGMAIMLITHDLGVVAEMCERVVVMYGGKVVEEGDAVSIFKSPLHPYTEGLLNSIPRMDEDVDRLHVIEGVVPNPLHLPEGCRFHPRCPYAIEKCKNTQPPLEQVAPGRYVACFLSADRLAKGVR